jgi:hypothetical protein
MIEETQSRTEFWSQHLAAAKKFNGGRQKYCDTHGLKLATFYQWKKKIEGLTRPRKRRAFVPAIIQEIQPARAEKIDQRSLPDARWVAEVLSHLIAATR